MASKLKILVWENVDSTDEEPMVDVTIPTYLAKWIPRMMKFMPRKARAELWGEEVDMAEFNLEEMIDEAIKAGRSEIMEVKGKDPQTGKRSLMRVFLEE